MQGVRDIFAIWGPENEAVSLLAVDIGEKRDTVYRWKRRGRIPDDAWQPVIDAARAKGKVLTIADMHAANRPAKLRGRAAHKMRPLRRRRGEAREYP